MAVQRNRMFFLLLFLLFSKTVMAMPAWTNYIKPPEHLYLTLAGGYGVFEHSYQKTGISSLLRIGFGSYWNLKSTLELGEELGFQTANQLRLSNQITSILGANIVPIYVSIKTPVDLLLVANWKVYRSVVIQAKVGGVFLSSTVTGGDIDSKNAVLPELQVGIGMNVSKRSRMILSYQHYFGNTPTITPLDITAGTSTLTGMPTWQAGLLTFETRI